MNVMEDTLESIFKMQTNYIAMMNLDKYPEGKEQRVFLLSTAIFHEAVELQSLTSWKWWKKPTTFDETRAKEELIDIWHFVVQMSLELELTPKNILERLSERNSIDPSKDL